MLRALVATSVSLLLVLPPALSATVDHTGALRESVDLVLPPFHGIEPKIQLVYRHNQANGPFGIGFKLAGLPEIRRTSISKGLPRQEQSDRFFAEGNELLNCEGGTPAWLGQRASCRLAVPGLRRKTCLIAPDGEVLC